MPLRSLLEGGILPQAGASRETEPPVSCWEVSSALTVLTVLPQREGLRVRGPAGLPLGPLGTPLRVSLGSLG